MGWGLLGGIAGGIISAGGQKNANKTNREIADQANRASASQARINRNWQEEMSNTAYQRQSEDMKKAGLNPLLGLGGGASTGSGGQGQAHTSSMENEMEGIGASAMAAVALEQTLKKQKAEVGNLKATKQNIKADTYNKFQSGKVLEWEAKKAKMKHKAVDGSFYSSVKDAVINTTKAYQKKFGSQPQRKP